MSDWEEIPLKQDGDWEEIPVGKASGPGAAQSMLEGFGKTASLGYLPQLQAGAEVGIDKLQRLLGIGVGGREAKAGLPGVGYTQARDENIQRQQLESQEHPVASSAGKVAGVVPQLFMPSAPSALGRIAQSAAVGAAYNPGDVKGQVDPLQARQRLGGAAVSGVISGGLEGVGAGLRTVAPKIMAKATNLYKSKNLSPEDQEELAKELLQQGVVGTQNQMLGQVTKKYPQAEQRLKEAVKDMRISGEEASKPLSDLTSRWTAPDSGIVPSNKQELVNEALERAKEVAARGGGEISANDALKFSRMATDNKFTKAGFPKVGGQALIDQTEGAAYKNLIKQASPEARAALRTEQAFSEAQKGLKKQPMSMDIPGSDTLSKFFPETALQSLAAQGAYQASRLATPTSKLLSLLGLNKLQEDNTQEKPAPGGKGEYPR